VDMQPLIDPERIDEITQGRAELLRRFTALLQETLDDSTPDLGHPDLAVRSLAAHRLKGASANMGAVGLWRLFQRLEENPAAFDDATQEVLSDVRARTVAALLAQASALEAPEI